MRLYNLLTSLILVVVCLQIGYNLLNLDASYQTIDDDFNTKNIGVPSHFYYSSIFQDSFVYLFSYTKVDVVDISNPQNIHINRTYDFDFKVDSYYYGFYYFYNLSQNEFFHYYICNSDINHSLLVYNKYELINNTFVSTLETQTIVNITRLRERAYFTQQNNKMMVVYPTMNYTVDDYKIYLLTFDITNKSAPLLENQILLHQETNITIANQPSENRRHYEDIEISNNYLYLLRSYFTYINYELNYVNSYLKIWDIGNSSDPKLINSIELEKGVVGLCISILSNLIFYKLPNYGFLIYNCTMPNNIELLVDYKNDRIPIDFIIDGDVLFLILSDEIEILDFSIPQSLKIISQYVNKFQGNGYFNSGILRDEYLYVLRNSEFSDRSFYVFDCTDVKNIKRLYPEGYRISDAIVFKLVVTTTIVGPILGLGLIVTIIVVAVRIRKKKTRL
ncbi:MAG: hypothetical protein JXA54_02160 [Candidatus Heimdallarchaeota archaeon]|nr:hypothetical protein [Candidatus Heimdallarchaeota archaeon]